MKERLLELLNEIQKSTGMNQYEVSEKAGYSSNYLSEAISKNQVSKKMIGNVERVLKESGSIHIADAIQTLTTLMVEAVASHRTILTVLSRIQAGDDSPKTLHGVYQSMLEENEMRVKQELKLKV